MRGIIRAMVSLLLVHCISGYFVSPIRSLSGLRSAPSHTVSKSIHAASHSTPHICKTPLGGLRMLDDRSGTASSKWRRSTKSRYELTKILPLNNGGSLIIGRDGWFISSDGEGVGNFYGDQAIPLELDGQAAWLLYRDGAVVCTVTGMPSGLFPHTAFH